MKFFGEVRRLLKVKAVFTEDNRTYYDDGFARSVSILEILVICVHKCMKLNELTIQRSTMA